jgi:hypothetical protein
MRPQVKSAKSSPQVLLNTRSIAPQYMFSPKPCRLYSGRRPVLVATVPFYIPSSVLCSFKSVEECIIFSVRVSKVDALTTARLSLKLYVVFLLWLI